jgi:uncharacterized protein (TIGR02099 family)
MHRRLRTFLWKCWYRIWAVIAIGTILVALVFGIARMLFLLVPGYKAELESMASQALGHNVSIGNITTDWKWFRPRLKLLNVVVHAGGDGAEILQVGQLILGVNLLDSAFERKLDVDDITLQGAAIRVSRDAKGGVTVQDLPVYSPATDLPAGANSGHLPAANNEPAEAGDKPAAEFELTIPPVLQNRTIKLADISIDYSDAIFDLHYFAPNVDIALQFQTGKAALYLDVKLPAELGERLELAIETDGDLETPKELNGRVFFRGTGLEPANWKQPVWVAEKVKSGTLDLSLWFDIRQPGDIDISGTVKAVNVDLVLPVAEGKQAGNWRAEELQLKYYARSDGKNIRAHIKDLQFKRDGREWLPGGISLRTPKDRAVRFKKGELAVDFLRLEDIWSSVSTYIPYMQAAQDAGLVSAHGDLDSVYLRWDFTHAQQRILAQGNFKSLALYGENNIPTIKGVTGSVRMNDTRLAVNLDIETLHIDYPQLFREALPPLSVTGELQVQRDERHIRISSRNFHITNPDVEADSWFEYEIDLDDKNILADHYSRFEVFNTSAAPRYLPAKRMRGKKGVQYLDNAFISGGVKNGELTLRGPLNKMPFRNGEGVFRVEFDSDNNVLNFWEPGPYATGIRAHAVFDGPSMVIYGYETKVLDSVGHDITVRIDNFKDAPLLVSANVYGSVDDAWTYIKETELKDIFEVVADQMSVGGMQAATLEMNIPIHNDDLAPEDQLRSRISIDGGLYAGKVSFRDWKLHFADVNSRVRFTEASVKAEPFSVLLNEQPVTVHIDSETVNRENIVTAHLQGDIAVGDFLQSIEIPVADFVHGRSLMRAALEMEIGDRDDDNRRNPLLRVSGDLQGVAVNLPEPLLKPAGLAASLSIAAEFEKPDVITRFRYRDRIGGVIRSEHGEGAPQITYADIKLDAKGLLPVQTAPRGVTQTEPGIFIEGGVEAVNIDAWRDMPWMQGNKSVGILDKIETINIFTEQFTYLNRTVDNLQLDIRPELHNWKFQLASDLINGQVLIPRKGFATRGLSVDLEYFNYDEIHTGTGGKQPVPSDIPPFRIKIDRLWLNDWDLRDVVMLADRSENAVTVHSLRINDPAVGLVGSGEWSMDDQGNHYTKAKLKFDSGNIGEGLSRFGFANLIKGSTGTAEFDIAWDAMPSEFDLAILQGSAKLDFKQGQVLNIEPGSGRILGLLSLQMIPRRLALDFRDLFNEGFAYDDMAGSFSFSDGHAYSSDYRINGPVGRIEISGRTGLVDQDYDQHIKFRPKLSSSLPIIGAIVGGATGGWAMVVMDSMVRIFGGDTDDLIQAHYTVTGSWADPLITPVKRPKKSGTNTRERKPESKVNVETE